MIIWLLALVLFVSLGYVGFCLGAIRVGTSVLGLLVGALLCRPLGHLVYPLLAGAGMKNPILIWLLGPFLVFLVILIVFKIVGMTVHQKVDVYYKHHPSELKMGLWNRLNTRLGISVGLLNAAIYLVLISWVIYAFSYWTVQMTTSETASLSVRLLNSAGKGLEDSGMAKVAAAVDSMPDSYYQAADVVGLVYHNDLLEARLSRYPAFLALGQQPEFQDIGNDTDFTELRQKQAPIAEILNYPKMQSLLNNQPMLNQLWAVLTPNLPDLENYLRTGHSEKYDGEKILGRWDFDLGAALNLLKRSKTNVSLVEMQRTKQLMTLSFAKTTFVAAPAPEKQAYLKSLGKVRPPPKPNMQPTVDDQNFRGQWSGEGDNYQLTFPDKGGVLDAVIDGDKLIVSGDTFPMVFDREN